MLLKKIGAIMCLTVQLILLISCSNMPTNSTVPSLKTSTRIYFECAHGIVQDEENDNSLEYDGSPLSINYFFKNGNVAANFGLLLFVNGTLQPYSVGASTTDSLMNTVRLAPNEDKTIQITFNPTTGENGEKYKFQIVALFDVIDGFSSPTIGPSFVHAISQSKPWTISMLSDASVDDKNLPSTYAISNDLYNIQTDGSKFSEIQDNAIMRLDVENTKSSETVYPATLYIPNKKEDAVKYRVYAFVNNELVLFDEQPHQDIVVEGKSEIKISLLFNSAHQFTLKDFIYFLAVPLDLLGNADGQAIEKTRTMGFVADN